MAPWCGRSAFTAPTSQPLDLSIQVATQVARLFNESLKPDFRPSDPAAYESYLRHLQAIRTYGRVDQSVYWLERTLAIDPTWGDGWRQLILERTLLFSVLGDPAQRDGARIAYERMRAGPPENQRRAAPYYVAFIEGDFLGAEPLASFDAAQDGYYGLYVRLMETTGLHEEAEPWARRYVQEYPYSPDAWDGLGRVLANTGRFDEALEAGIRGAELVPPGSPGPTAAWGTYAALAGDMGTAEQRLAEIQALASREQPASVAEQYLHAMSHGLEFSIAYESGDHTRGARVAKWFADRGQHSNAAFYYFLLDDARASAQLSLAQSEVGLPWLTWLYAKPFISPEQRDTEFYRRMQDALGLTDELRLEMCRRAARQPPESLITCDPKKYAY